MEASLPYIHGGEGNFSLSPHLPTYSIPLRLHVHNPVDPFLILFTAYRVLARGRLCAPPPPLLAQPLPTPTLLIASLISVNLFF